MIFRCDRNQLKECINIVQKAVSTHSSMPVLEGILITTDTDKIILTGIKKIEINKTKIIKLINNKNILKIKNKAEIKYDLEKISKQKNLKGIFIKKLLKKIEENPDEEKIIKKSIEIGLKMFE